MNKNSKENGSSFIPISQPCIGAKELEYVTDAFKSGWVSSLGRYIDMFEQKFAEYCGTKFAVSTSNGTCALHLALVALGVKAEDEVIIPDLTFVATGNAVKYIGAKPVTVDVEASTLCISPDAIKSAITPKTRAIIPVHLYGHPANMSEVSAIAKEYGLHVVEDAAEAHGAQIDGKRVGAFGDTGVFSFYGNKIITTGEGGIITTNSEELYNRMTYLRDHAMSKDKRYWHDEVGFNYRMTNLQAALGVAQLENIDEIIELRAKIFHWYKDELSGIKRIKLNYKAQWAQSVYWLVCLEISGYSELDRNKFIDTLKAHGIDSRPFFYPLSSMPSFENRNNPNALSASRCGINLPCFVGLTRQQVKFICTIIKQELS